MAVNLRRRENRLVTNKRLFNGTIKKIKDYSTRFMTNLRLIQRWKISFHSLLSSFGCSRRLKITNMYIKKNGGRRPTLYRWGVWWGRGRSHRTGRGHQRGRGHPSRTTSDQSLSLFHLNLGRLKERSILLLLFLALGLEGSPTIHSTVPRVLREIKRILPPYSIRYKISGTVPPKQHFSSQIQINHDDDNSIIKKLKHTSKFFCHSLSRLAFSCVSISSSLALFLWRRKKRRQIVVAALILNRLCWLSVDMDNQRLWDTGDWLTASYLSCISLASLSFLLISSSANSFMVCLYTACLNWGPKQNKALVLSICNCQKNI